MADDIVKDGEMAVFLAPVVTEIAKHIIDGEMTEVFVVTADNDEDHRTETNLHKRVAMIPYSRYAELLEIEYMFNDRGSY